MEFIRFEKISLKNHPELNEMWVQDRIAEEPNLLGLGDLILKDKERIHPRAGRLDILLQDTESTQRYEVEIQLGSTDESHIIRTIEYWDIERRRYPQYEHTAVIVAEDITSRFLNVVSLFNGFIPIIAIQMSALKIGNSIGLNFTTVLNRMSLGLVDEDEEVKEVTDRSYWEKRASKKAMDVNDELFQIAKSFIPNLEMKYNKFYIGLSQAGVSRNQIIMRPAKGFVRLEPRLPNNQDTQDILESAGLDVMDYDTRWGRYRIRLRPEDMKTQSNVISGLIKQAIENGNND